MPSRALPDHPQFTSLRGAVPGLVTAVQAVDDAPGIHIDIESDDPDAETARLLGLGAEQVGRWLDCRILRVPGGQIVCVLPVESDPELFDAHATTWH
ncbi:VOC family protein [Pseudonocardia adelaidensis]|uniref:VOC family protein n=1 Tax=Pseudonocardia adelaidensis TaxID=648754 RepID=A0ABP9NP54_9PSEU